MSGGAATNFWSWGPNFLGIFDPKLKIVPSNFEKYSFDDKFQTWCLELNFYYTFHKIGGGVNPWCNKCFTFFEGFPWNINKVSYKFVHLIKTTVDYEKYFKEVFKKTIWIYPLSFFVPSFVLLKKWTMIYIYTEDLS